MKFQFTNRASTHLAAPITVDSTTITVSPGTGDRFPSATPEQPAQITIVSSTGANEIVQCTSRAGDVLTILRGQENSSVGAFAEGSLVELRLTAAVLNSFLPLSGGALEGDLNLQGHNIYNTNLYGFPKFDNLATNAVYPPDANAAVAIQFLNGGVIPRINGNSILTTGILWGAIFLWWGRADQLPPWLKICDGSLNTPDLRNRFPLGANHDGDAGEYGGDFDNNTGFAGAHSHDGATGNQSLGSFNLPGLTAPTISVTTGKLLTQALGDSQPTQPNVPYVKAVSMTGGGSYSGTALHAHGIGEVGNHVHTVSVRPPFFKLHFVMFRSMQLN